MRHTYHPNTFGLLYGKTTKTACGKRVRTSELAKPLDTDCPGCREVVITDMLTQQEMFDAATQIAKSEGYDSLADWARANRPS